MLYANLDLKVEDVNLSSGDLYKAVVLGGEYQVVLPTFWEEDIPAGWYEDQFIGETKKGNPRISDGDDGYIYLILSSKGDGKLDRDGKIESTNSNDMELIDKGRDGHKGSKYQVRVLKIYKSMFIRIRYSSCNKFLVIYVDCEDMSIKHLGDNFETLSLTSDMQNLKIPGFDYIKKRFNNSSLWYYI